MCSMRNTGGIKIDMEEFYDKYKEFAQELW